MLDLRSIQSLDQPISPGSAAEISAGLRHQFRKIRFQMIANILGEIRPTIICEVSAENQACVTSQLRKARYVLFDGEMNKKTRRPLNVAPWSTIALPSERLDNGCTPPKP